MSALLFFVGLAWGGSAVAVVGPRVEGVVDVPADVDAVRALVRDPRALARAVGRDVELRSLGGEGVCERFVMALGSPLGAQRGTIDVCDTATGSAVRLVESDDFVRYDYSWQVDALPGGVSRVTHSLELVSAWPVPAGWVRRLCAREVGSTLDRLATWVGVAS